MIYDLFMFGGYDEDILDIRLNTLNSVVDRFCIVESRFSHSGIEKGLKWPEIKHKYDFIKDKILYFAIDSDIFNRLSSETDPWVFEQNSRQLGYEVIKNRLNNQDILLVCDNDEIPNPDILAGESKKLTQPITFCGDYFYFCLDLYGRKSTDGFLVKPDLVSKTNLNWLRSNRTNYRENIFRHVNNSSWHYSTVGTPEQILNKMRYFSHSNECPKDVLDLDWIKQCIVEKRGSLARSSKIDECKLIELNQYNCPKYLFNNLEKFKHLLYRGY